MLSHILDRCSRDDDECIYIGIGLFLEDNDDSGCGDGGGDDYPEKSWYEIICTAQGATISNSPFYRLIPPASHHTPQSI